MYKFGTNSNNHLITCHPDIQLVLTLALHRTRIDFGISFGHRSTEVQKTLYAEGKSECDGITKKSKHQSFPSDAVDIYAYHPDTRVRRELAQDKCSLSYIAGIIISCAKELKEKGEIKSIITWGGNWDRDGIILKDQKFDDLYHFERKRG